MDTIKVIYTIMLIFVLFMVRNIIKNRKNLEGDIIKFKARPKISLVLLNVLLLVMLFTVEGWYMKLVLLVLSLFFLYANTEPIFFSDSGIYHNSSFSKWEDLRKWAFDEEKKQLVMEYKVNGRDYSWLLPIRLEDKEKMHKIIKAHKKK